MKAQHLIWLAFATNAFSLAVARGDLNPGWRQYQTTAIAVTMILLAIGITQVGKTGPVEWVVALVAIVAGLAVVWPAGISTITDSIQQIGGAR